MGKSVNAILGVLVYSNVMFSGAWADTVPMTLPAPLPKIELDLPTLPRLHPAKFDVPVHSATAVSNQDVSKAVERQADISAFGFPCKTSVTLRPAADAMLDVAVNAPCKPNKIATLHYEGLSADVTLSITGEAQFQIPALTYQTQIKVVVGNDTRHAEAVTPDLNGFARIALGWSEFTAPILDGKAPRHLPIEVKTIGDGTGRVVQVVSHHLDPDGQSGVIRLGMTIPVNAQNCATSQSGQVVQHMPGLSQLRYGLTVAAAGCDRIGRNLELNNILQDLKLASN